VAAGGSSFSPVYFGFGRDLKRPSAIEVILALNGGKWENENKNVLSVEFLGP
jgi:hypothetical protein